MVVEWTLQRQEKQPQVAEILLNSFRLISLQNFRNEVFSDNIGLPDDFYPKSKLFP